MQRTHVRGSQLKIVLLSKAYGAYRGRLLETIRSEISTMVAELDANLVSIGTDKKNRIIANIEGEDEEFVANALAKEYGKSLLSDDLSPNAIYPGRFLDELDTDCMLILESQILHGWMH
jgi:hypothetical protein